MYIEKSIVESITILIENTYLLKVFSPSIASTIQPGQFCNIKVSETDYPLLRRPFSVCDVDGDYIYFMFDVHGEGTRILEQKKNSEVLDILGPLGKGFDFNGEFDSAIIIAGGIGAAPFPYLIKKLSKDVEITCLIGGKSKKNIIEYGMKNILISTDDGSSGFHGNVVELLKNQFPRLGEKKIRVFSCGPNAMLKSLQVFVNSNNIDCQISTESAMACGFGICQGCPIDNSNGDGYYLICKDGPVFGARMVKL